MSKLNHSFSVSVACIVGVNKAIILQHFIFLQDGTEDGWVRKSNAAIRETYPYLTSKQIRGAVDGMEKDGILFSRIDNESKADRTKSYYVTPEGRTLYGLQPFAERANAIVQKGKSDVAERANEIVPKGQMLNRYIVDNIIESVVEREHAHAQNVSSTLDAAIPPPPQVPPPPPAPWKAIDCTHEIELMRNDEACAFRFVRDTSLPQAEYPAALDAFLLKAQTEAKVYNNRTDIRSHFFNWASGPYKKMKNERPKFSFGPDSARRAIESAERLAREIESGNY